MANARVHRMATAFALAVALIFVVCFVFCSAALGSYQAKNNYLDVTFGETSSDWWSFMYAPDTWGDACYREHFGVFSRNWNSTKASDYDFQVDQRFDESSSGRTARLRFEDLNVTREVYLPAGDAKFFTISYILTNSNRTSKLRAFASLRWSISISSPPETPTAGMPILRTPSGRTTTSTSGTALVETNHLQTTAWSITDLRPVRTGPTES